MYEWCVYVVQPAEPFLQIATNASAEPRTEENGRGHGGL